MHIITAKPGGIITVTLGLLLATSVHAFDLGNIMSPSRWMDGSEDDRYYDDYYGGRDYGYPGNISPGYGGLPGFGYGGFPDQHYGGIPGYGGLPDLGGDPLLGYGGSPGYRSVPDYGQPSTPRQVRTESPEAAEIKRLKERIRKLEETCKQAQPAWSGHSAGSAPWGQQPDNPATTAPWGQQPGNRATTVPWGEQPGVPATTAPWGDQTGYPSTTAPWGDQLRPRYR